MSTDSLRIAIVGLGNHASHAYLPFITHSHDIELTAICDLPEKKGEITQLVPNTPIFPNIEELVGRCLIDAAIISTPHYLHYAQAECCLVHRINALVDKPLALKGAEARMLQQRAEMEKLVLMTAVPRRYGQVRQKMRELLQSPSLGDITACDISYFRPKAKNFSASWRNLTPGGGALIDAGYHLLDVVLDLFPQPIERVQCEFGTREYEVDVLATLLIAFKGGSHAILRVDLHDMPKFLRERVLIQGTRGEVSFERLRDHSGKERREASFTNRIEGPQIFDGDEPDTLDVLPLRNFIQRIRGRKGSPRSLALDVQIVSVIEQAYHNAEDASFGSYRAGTSAIGLFGAGNSSSTYDVFLSYRMSDRPIVETIAERLRAKGLKPWFDRWELSPGSVLSPLLDKGIRSAKTLAVMIGKEDHGGQHPIGWRGLEIEAAIQEFVATKKPVIPVYLPNAKPEVGLPPFMRNFLAVDLGGGGFEAGLDELVWGIKGDKPLSASGLAEPLYKAEHDFLQVLLSKIALTRRGSGVLLDVSFNHETATIRTRRARRLLRLSMPDFEHTAQQLQGKLDSFILDGETEAYTIENSDFLFRFASGGTLPILQIGEREYFCLFLRCIHPIGWNVANGGCNSLDELRNPLLTIERELQEELIIVGKQHHYLLGNASSQLADGAGFSVVRMFWDRKFDNLGARRFGQLERKPLELKYIPGPDSVTICFGAETKRLVEDVFLTMTTDDFGIELDRIAKIRIPDIRPHDLGNELRLCDGELNAWVPVNRPIGLFPVDEFASNMAPGIWPELLYFDGKVFEGHNLGKVIKTDVVPQLANAYTQLGREAVEEFLAIEDGYAPCPVTRRLITRYLDISR